MTDRPEADQTMRPSNTQILIYALVLATVLAQIGKEAWEWYGR